MPTWKREEATRRNAVAPDEGDPCDGRGDDREEAHGAPGRADARTRRGRDGWRAAEPGEDPGAPKEHRPHPDDHARGRTRWGDRGPGESRSREGRSIEGGNVMANLRKHELIGLRVEVVDATDPSQEHVRGRVVDETRNMLVVDVQGEEKRIPKHGSRFRFDVPGGFEVDGDEIRFRPEDRVKKAR